MTKLVATLSLMIISTAGYGTTLPAGSPTYDISDANSFENLVSCKATLINTVLSATGFEDLKDSKVVKLGEQITFSKLTRIASKRCGMGSDGCEMSTAIGTLLSPGNFKGSYTLEFGKGSCNVVKVNLQSL